MNFKNADMDMLHGPLAKKLLLFTLPIALIVTLSSGLSIGANILIANRIGRNRKDELPSAIRTTLLLSLILGVLGTILGLSAAKPLLRLIQTLEHILPSATLYLRIYLLSYPFLLLYDFGSAVLRARGNSRYPFFVLAFSGLVNTGLNLFFVIVLHMGVAGVAAATGISNLLAALILLRRLWSESPAPDEPCQPHFSLNDAGEILKIGIPSAMQGAVFCFANIFVQASVNRFGETAIAGNTIALNFEYFTYYYYGLRTDCHHLYRTKLCRRTAKTVPPDSLALPFNVAHWLLGPDLYHCLVPNLFLRAVYEQSGCD